MKIPTRAKTMGEFQHNVQEAIYEVEDMLAAQEDDTEDMAAALDLLHDLEQQLKKLLFDIESGVHEFRDEDLPFIQALQDRPSFLMPIQHLLNVINETHRKGLLLDKE